MTTYNLSKPGVILLPQMKTNERRKPTQTGTKVLIRVGPQLIATAVLGGKYDVSAALREFKRGNTKFIPEFNQHELVTAVRNAL